VNTPEEVQQRIDKYLSLFRSELGLISKEERAEFRKAVRDKYLGEHQTKLAEDKINDIYMRVIEPAIWK